MQNKKHKHKIRLAVLGACCTRDVFNSEFVPNWRDDFYVVLNRFQPNFISLMSKPIPFNRNMLFDYRSNTDDLNFGRLVDEFDKSTLNHLVSVNPEVLIIDFYSDAYNGVREIPGYGYIVDHDKLRKVPAYLQLNANSIKVTNEYKKYLNIWKSSFDKFMSFMKTYLPKTKIVLNCAKAAKAVKNKDGSIDYPWDNIDIDSINKAWEEMDQYAILNYELSCIKYNEEYFADPEHIYGKWLVHYYGNYYIDMYNYLMSILKHNDECNLNNEVNFYNLILNGTLNIQSSFFRYMDEQYTIRYSKKEKTNYINFKNVDRKAKYKQLWFHSIKLSFDKKENVSESIYSVQFECRIKDIKKLGKDKIIFSIRLFNDRNALWASESIKEYRVLANIDEHTNNNSWVRYSVSFSAEAEWANVGCVVSECGIIDYKNVCLHRGDKYIDVEESLTEKILLDGDNLIDPNKMNMLSVEQLSDNYLIKWILKKCIKHSYNNKRGYNK